MRTDDEMTMRAHLSREKPEPHERLCHLSRSRPVTYACERTDGAVGVQPLSDCRPSMAAVHVHHVSRYGTRNDKCCCRGEPANHRRLRGAANGLGASETTLDIAKDDQGDQRDKHGDCQRGVGR